LLLVKNCILGNNVEADIYALIADIDLAWTSDKFFNLSL